MWRSPGARAGMEELFTALERGQVGARRRRILVGVAVLGIDAAGFAGWQQLELAAVEARRCGRCVFKTRSAYVALKTGGPRARRMPCRSPTERDRPSI